MKMENGTLVLTNDEVRYEIDAYWNARVDCSPMWVDAELEEHSNEANYKRVYSKGEFIGDLAHTGSDPWVNMYEISNVWLDDNLADEYGDSEYPLYDAEFEMDYDYFFKKAEEAWESFRAVVKGYDGHHFKVVAKKDEVVVTTMKAKEKIAA